MLTHNVYEINFWPLTFSDKQGNVRELEGRIPDEIINLKGKDDANL